MIVRRLLYCFLLLLSFSIKSQNSSSWFFVLNNYDGTNLNQGVEATCSLAVCNNEDVIFIKLENKNNKKVKASWVHMIQTKDKNSVYTDGNVVSITLEANSTRTGSCSNDKNILMVKLKDFKINKENFENYIAKNFYLNLID